MLRASILNLRPAAAAASSHTSSFLFSSASLSSSLLRRSNSVVASSRPIGGELSSSPFSSFSFAATTTMTTAFCAAAALPSESFRCFSSSTRVLLGSKNPYKVLKIPQGASVKDIRAAYRKRSMLTHPDRPGGSHEAFQETQEAYEQIKSGVYIAKDGSGGSGDKSSGTSRWQGLRYKTATRDSASFEDVMKDMHSKAARDSSAGPADPNAADAPPGAGDEPPKKQRFNPQDIRIQAWFRLLTAWAVVFLTLRLAFFFVFPPKVEKKARPNPALLAKNDPLANKVVPAKKQPPPPVRLPSGGNTPQPMH